MKTKQTRDLALIFEKYLMSKKRRNTIITFIHSLLESVQDLQDISDFSPSGYLFKKQQKQILDSMVMFLFQP